jgi:hypothetical protein
MTEPGGDTTVPQGADAAHAAAAAAGLTIPDASLPGVLAALDRLAAQAALLWPNA